MGDLTTVSTGVREGTLVGNSDGACVGELLGTVVG